MTWGTFAYYVKNKLRKDSLLSALDPDSLKLDKESRLPIWNRQF